MPQRRHAYIGIQQFVKIQPIKLQILRAKLWSVRNSHSWAFVEASKHGIGRGYYSSISRPLHRKDKTRTPYIIPYDEKADIMFLYC